MAWCCQASSHYRTWANADPGLCHYTPSPGHNELRFTTSQINKLTLPQVVAWCRQATSHYLSQYRGLSERQFLHSSTGESNTSCWVFHKQMVESFQTLAQYWKPIQNLGTKIWHHLKNNILSMVMLKLWANLSPSYVKSWLNVKLFIISCCLAVQEVLCSPAVEGHKPG